MSKLFEEGEGVYWLRRNCKPVPATVIKLRPHRVLIRLEVGDHNSRKHVLPRNLRRRDVDSLTALIVGLLGCTALMPTRFRCEAR
jgi:hypothetical protein